MKKLASILAVSLALTTACTNKTDETSAYDGVPSTSDSLRIALANQDSLLTLMNDIADGMEQIKKMENLLSSNSDLTAESPDRRQQIRNDMQLIQQSLQIRRDRLAELEKKLKDSSANNATLQKAIQNLKQQISDQEGTIETLRTELANANIHIEKLTANIDSLNTHVASVTAAKEQVEKEASDLTDEINTCYYALGSKKELKEHKLIETGFLRKTKIMPDDFEQSYFTVGDKRKLTKIDTHSRKAKILTNQPSDSYTITDAPNGNKVVEITSPARFWSVSNFLVIQVD